MIKAVLFVALFVCVAHAGSFFGFTHYSAFSSCQGAAYETIFPADLCREQVNITDGPYYKFIQVNASYLAQVNCDDEKCTDSCTQTLYPVDTCIEGTGFNYYPNGLPDSSNLVLESDYEDNFCDGSPLYYVLYTTGLTCDNTPLDLCIQDIDKAGSTFFTCSSSVPTTGNGTTTGGPINSTTTTTGTTTGAINTTTGAISTTTGAINTTTGTTSTTGSTSGAINTTSTSTLTSSTGTTSNTTGSTSNTTGATTGPTSGPTTGPTTGATTGPTLAPTPAPTPTSTPTPTPTSAPTTSTTTATSSASSLFASLALLSVAALIM